MAADSSLLYAGSAQRYDELLDNTGTVRPHWRGLIEHLTDGGPDAVRRSVELARRLVIENGVTYNVYADPQGKDRPWLLDPLPLLIGAEEWQQLEAGVIQRTRLLNEILRDLYGPQQLLSQGILPPELAYGHPNFLWPAHGLKPLRDVWLYLHAVDLARAPDGQWRVLADRTQSPSGPGYALENRQIVARVLPRLINNFGVRPLDGFFTELRSGLMEPLDSEPQLTVVLTPGPFNETYFEHAYLARRLGLPLVQGQDLTVRASSVFLKTFSGLRRVHAILRRVDDDFCDPLELRADSTLGVPGLLSAVRAGRVVLANALGSGVLESPAWSGFLPGAAQALLGESLRLPSVATWWCGERPALKYVTENLEQLVIRGTFPNQRFQSVFGAQLTARERTALLARLRGRPYAYAASERVMLSHAPVWRAGGTMRLAPRALSLRLYAVWTPQGYKVMPGGLARIAAEDVSDIVSSQRGGGSKDVWVMPGSDAQATAAIAPMPPRQVRQAELPSQLVENLYWLGRYSERCEEKARLLRATLAMRTERTVWPLALATCVARGVLESDSDPLVSLYEGRLNFGLAADLGRFSWAATQARSRLSAAHWRSISLMQRQFHEAGQHHAEPVETLDRLLVSLTALSGFALDDMTQDDGWRLLMLGRRLERVQFLAEIFAALFGEGALPQRGPLDWLLDVCSSSITYRTRYVAAPQLGAVMQLLVFDASNPRALAFQWQKIQRTLRELEQPPNPAAADELQPAVAALLQIAGQDLEGTGADGAQRRIFLAGRLTDLATAAQQVSDRLTMGYFSHVAGELRSVAM
jgi:uncharacterized circularly permuted ATP-grasp superfamily protein/uncharacterized alpha-E superfamily protein